MELEVAHKINGKEIELLTIKEWSEKYGGGIQPSAVDYLMKNDKIDYTKVGNDRYVAMTEKTLSYIPNKSKKRAILQT